jgi:hypothetical protein
LAWIFSDKNFKQLLLNSSQLKAFDKFKPKDQKAEAAYNFKYLA